MGRVDLASHRVSIDICLIARVELNKYSGNAAEHFTAVSVSVKDKLDLSISVAVSWKILEYKERKVN